MTPPHLAGFDYLSRLGSGGFADVLLYEQQWPQQRVAVKVIRPEVAMTAREKALFRAEADAMARLADHPYIVSVLTAGETESGLPYLVMRYCPPPDLGARVRTEPLGVVDAVATGVKLASAVETAHRSGLLHRDIKPANVLMTTYHEPALTDFGIAARIHDPEAEDEVRMSYPWAPPELIAGRSAGSVASDVYSLGATIWNLLVGWSPFVLRHGDNSDPALARRILDNPPPRTGREDVPPALEELLAQCLAKDPDARPHTALELARGLQRIETDLGAPQTPVAVEDARSQHDDGSGEQTPATRVRPVSVISAHGTTGTPHRHSSRNPAPAGPRHRPTLWWSVAGLVLLAALGGVLLWGGNDGGDDPSPTPSASASTPAPVVPEPIPAVTELTGTRQGDRVLFTWTQPERAAGDSWRWSSVHSDAQGRVSRPRATVPVSGREVCVRVSLIRDGTTGPAEDACVR